MGEFKIKFSKYTLDSLHKESDLFFDWFLKYSLKNKNKNKIKRLLKNELSKVYKKFNAGCLYWSGCYCWISW